MKKEKELDFSKVAANVIKVSVEDFAEQSYLPYAHYVITERALISEDGLKPVQRRILYAMDQLGLNDKKPHIKAAQIVGETMGKYHPHGDSSIGDALARLGQKFSMRVPLVDYQGSLGHTAGDPPAAPRYWEGRPTKAAMELISEIKDGAAKMGLNYDGKFPEPVQLPAKWPNGIINGTQGIAVGYSATVIPHNPGEVMDAVVALIKDPDLDIEGIAKIVKGPDYPTGGIIVGYDGIKDYFNTGKGSFTVRGKYTIEPGARGTHKIIFSEAPYQVSGEQILRAISNNKKKDRFKEISEFKDLSDRANGFRVTIGIKAGANPEVVLKDIFKWTPLEQRVSANMNVLVDGVPKVCSIKELLTNFIEFRSEGIVNKINYKLGSLKVEIERLDGIIKVLVDIDKAIKIIRNSEDAATANTQLMKTFKVNEEQATYILSMPLRRLTKADSTSIQQQIKDLREERDYLAALLEDESKFDEYMIAEIEETKTIIDDPRRTVVSNKSEAQLAKEAEAIKKANERYSENSPYYVTLFANDTIIKTLEPYVQERSPDAIITQVNTRAKENLIFVKHDGSALRIPVSFVPEDTIMEVSVVTGLPKNTFVGVGKEELDKKKDQGLLLVTSDGGVNVVNGGFPFADNFQLVKLSDDEEVISATYLSKEDSETKSIVMLSSDGYVLKFPVEQIRTSNTGAGTVLGMNLNDEAILVGVSVTNPENGQVVSCSHKTIKVTNLTEIPLRNRNAKGVILQRLNKGDTVLNGFASERVVANKNGRSLRLPEPTERTRVGDKRSGADIILGHHEFA